MERFLDPSSIGNQWSNLLYNKTECIISLCHTNFLREPEALGRKLSSFLRTWPTGNELGHTMHSRLTGHPFSRRKQGSDKQCVRLFCFEEFPRTNLQCLSPVTSSSPGRFTSRRAPPPLPFSAHRVSLPKGCCLFPSFFRHSKVTLNRNLSETGLSCGRACSIERIPPKNRFVVSLTSISP